MRNHHLYTLLLVLYAGVIQAQCPAGDVVLSTQAEVDAFAINFPNCTEIDGNLDIGLRFNPSNIDNLGALKNLTDVSGDLSISSNNSLTQLDGLTALTNVGGNILISRNDMLVSLAALSNLSFVGGDLTIARNDALLNLNGLSALSAMDGKLDINRNDALTSLSGLAALASVGRNFDINNNDALTDLTALSALTTVGGRLLIAKNDALTDLTGLATLQSVGTILRVINNDVLTSLDGLAALTAVGGPVEVRDNRNLVDLTALSSLTSVGGRLTVSGNTLLSSLNGLESIDPSILTELVITNNPQLTECNIANVCTYLGIETNLASISGNSTGCSTRDEVEIICTCPEGDVVFTSQAEVDAFIAMYPNCSGIRGNLSITAEPFQTSDIDDLSGLSNFTGIFGSLEVTNNSLLTSLEGLEGVTTIGGDIVVVNNLALASISAFGSLISVEGNLVLIDNVALNSLDGLDHITAINGNLQIGSNPGISSTDGLSNVAAIAGDLIITNNNALTDIQGLERIDDSTIEFLQITSNSQLSSCAVQSICDYLDLESNSTLISGNGFGCDTREAIEADCTLLCPAGDVILSSQAEVNEFLSFYPNCLAISGSLTIGNSEMSSDINDLSPLNGLREVAGNLVIIDNDALSSLDGLHSIISVGGSLSIINNSSLTDITHLSNIDIESVTSITIEGNSSLSNCAIEIICDFVGIEVNEANIAGNGPGCESRGVVEFICNPPICPEGDVVLASQEQVEIFMADYPNCPQISGNLTIGVDAASSDITDVSGLGNVTMVSGTLEITNNGMLNTLEGLNALSATGGELVIAGNPILTDLNSLSNLISIGQGLGILDNASLTDLSGLSNLSTLDGNLGIIGNGLLGSLAGLENIDATLIDSVLVINNPQLSECAIQSICDYLEIEMNIANISGNAPGCNTREEVEMICNPVVPGDLCVDAFDVNSLLGQGINLPQISMQYNNSTYSATDTPAEGFECHFNLDPISTSLWINFMGDGNTYRLTAVLCGDEQSYLEDTQMALYSGSCDDLIPVVCNDDEDFDNDLFNAQIDEFTTMEGTEYFLLIDGFNDATGEFCLEVMQQMIVSSTDINKTDIELYPNPSTGRIQWRNITPEEVIVYNVQGHRILRYNSPGQELDLSALPEAVYILHFLSGDATYVARVVKKD